MKIEELPLADGLVARDDWEMCFHADGRYASPIQVNEIGPPSQPLDEQITVDKLASIEHFYGYTNGSPATEDHKGWPGTELLIVAVGQLTDGRWYSLSAGNDYTGWG